MAGVQSIERAFTILRALSLGPAGVTDLSQRTGLAKSTVSRLLSSLELERAVTQLANSTYALGDGIHDLGVAVRLDQSSIEIARPHMIELMELTGEAVGLDRLESTSVRTLLQLSDPGMAVVVRDWTDVSTPAHAVAAGLAIIAHSTRAVQDDFLTHEFEELTDHTVTDSGALKDRFARIQDEGYAWVIGEFVKDINSVGAPIFDAMGQPLFALHVHGPAFRFPGDRDKDELGTRVAESAKRIGARLAH